MRFIILYVGCLLVHSFVNAQTTHLQLPAKRTTAQIKIDGDLDESAWKEGTPAKNFIEQRPHAGAPEDAAHSTEMYILYDNTSVYIGGFCHERTRDSISRELIGRDQVGVNDFAGVILDTYNDGINAVGFFVTPYGEQFDVKYSTDNEDISWSAVWNSQSKMHENGWSFEMRIPYSALRFVSKDDQTWGINFVRRRSKTGQQFTWNPVDPKVNGFINQGGKWTGIGKINAPVRLSFSPYFSSYVNHFKSNPKDWTASMNGGMDVKYGISESFTLDMTLIPDFGQVQSDNRVLNLSPFEVKYNENRSFFTEGTELFNKGDLFYSRRVGSTPIHYDDAYSKLSTDETIIKNPQESKLVNATKVSGRTRKGLGIGVFNAVTRPMYALAEDNYGHSRKIETNPLTNYNIIVVDQTLKNNSSVSFINTNVLRSGADYDANVSAGLFNINNKKNTYNWSGKLAVSHLTNPFAKANNGYSSTLGFAKTGGRWNFQLNQETADDKYDINDMGILFNNNFIQQNLWTSYRWIEPKHWYKRVRVNFNAGYSNLYKSFPGQKLNTKYKQFNTNINANAQLKNLWFVGAFVGYMPEGNDFFEPRQAGLSFRTTSRIQFNPWFETNEAKKYYLNLSYFIAFRTQFKSRYREVYFTQRYRFSDKFSLSQQLLFNPYTNDAGYYKKFYENDGAGNPVLKDVIFSRRDRTTIENIMQAKYNFNNKSGITFRARHYWSKVEQKQLYDLNSDGSLSATKHTTVSLQHQNFNIFNIDAVYTWQFGPGSFINIVWKNEGSLFNNEIRHSYFRNFDHTVNEPQNNNLSVKIIYFLDYLDLKKWRKTNGKHSGV